MIEATIRLKQHTNLFKIILILYVLKSKAFTDLNSAEIKHYEILEQNPNRFYLFVCLIDFS